MSDDVTCSYWAPDECSGTPDCPPRCPRYVTPDGTAYTVHETDRPPASVLDDWTPDPPAPDDPDATLVATRNGAADGTASIDRSVEGVALVAGDGARVRTIGTAGQSLAVELARQVVARRVADGGAGPVRLYGPSASLDAIADELDAERVDGGVQVDPASRAAVRTTAVPGAVAPGPGGPGVRDLFAPETVAVVGATDREGAIGRVVTENLLVSFDGRVVPVTDRHDDVLGQPAVASLADLEDPADLAVVVLPPEAALDAVEAAGEAGVEAVAVLSAGFGEAGADGRRRESRLSDLVETYDLALVGPNSLGVLSTRDGMNASFAPGLPDDGGASLLSHSGAFVTATLDRFASARLGVRDVVSLGNAAGLDEADLLRSWGQDPETEVVLAYLEDVANGDRFLSAARDVTRTTPVVAVKSGRSETGAAAAASHTGAMVGDDDGFDAAFADAGVLRVDSGEALYDAGLAFSRLPLPTGPRVAVVSNAGGPGVLAVDAVEAAGLEPASLSEATVDELRGCLPETASATTPVDVLGDAPIDRFVDALDVVLADPVVDAALVVSTPHPLVDQPDLVRAVGEVADRHGTPVATCLSGGDPDPPVADALADASIPNYPDPSRAADALALLHEYAVDTRRHVTPPKRPPMRRQRVGSRLRVADLEGRTTLGAAATDLLGAVGVDTPAGGLATRPEEAGRIAEDIGSEVALKVASPDLVHKTDVGGVQVGVAPDEAAAAAGDLLSTVAAAAPGADLDGVVVQELVDGVECVAGITPHPRFGPVVTFGLGGTLVEHLDDVAQALAPLSHERARELVTDIDAAAVLEGARGAEPVDLEALAGALVRLSWLAADYDRVETLEVNPLVATADGAVAVDFHCSLSGAPSDEESESANAALPGE